MKTFNYSSMTLNQLEQVFDSWFSKQYNFAAEDNAFLERLINKNFYSRIYCCNGLKVN